MWEGGQCDAMYVFRHPTELIQLSYSIVYSYNIGLLNLLTEFVDEELDMLGHGDLSV